MRRRAFLGVAGATLTGLAGCAGVVGRLGGDGRGSSGGSGDGDGTPPTGTDDTPPTDRRATDGSSGVELPVNESALTQSVPRDDIPAITDPAFAEDWSGLELRVKNRQGQPYTTRPRLADGSLVIGVTRDGTARAYPRKVLNFHEVVNDDLGGPLLVTYCPLCRSGVTARREVGGRETVFGVDGRLFRSNLVLYDRRTDSLWSQLLATAIRGPATGERLALVPSSLTSWGDWRRAHPDTAVLLPPPHSGTVAGEDVILRDYASNPYSEWDDRAEVGPGATFDDERLHPKTLVVGITAGDVAKAFPFPAVRETGVVNDVVGEQPVVVAVSGEDLVAYDRTVDGTARSFRAAGRDHLHAGGSRWERATGRAVSGPHEGRRLDRATDVPPLFWFSWLDFHPGTALYTGD